jgi:hypothetical protein
MYLDSAATAWSGGSSWQILVEVSVPSLPMPFVTLLQPSSRLPPLQKQAGRRRSSAGPTPPHHQRHHGMQARNTGKHEHRVPVRYVSSRLAMPRSSSSTSFAKWLCMDKQWDINVGPHTWALSQTTRFGPSTNLL